MKHMTSRERILAALRGQQPDRVPISTYELAGYNSRAFENNDPSYSTLMDLIREKTDCLCMWSPESTETFLQSAYPVDMDVLEKRMAGAKIVHRTLHAPLGDLTNTYKIFDDVHTTWVTEHWCKNLDDVDKALSVPYEPVTFNAADRARINRELSDNGIVMDSVADPLWVAADLMEFGDYTVWALTEPEHFARTIEAVHARCMENLRRRLDAGPSDLYRICGPEYATPPYLPPDFFDRFVTPYVKEMTDLIHSRGALVRLHCHGRIGLVLDYIVQTGADAIDPCEAPPDGDIELADVKRRAGERLCVCGNLQLKLLEQGSTEEVAQAVHNCMAAAKQGGRYIILPTAAPINTPLAPKTAENYATFIETALAEGGY
jgi:uroporphyrinogen-III decarboxylase